MAELLYERINAADVKEKREELIGTIVVLVCVLAVFALTFIDFKMW